jgi:hypothetical protein
MATGLPLRVRWTLDGHEFNGPPDLLGREWVIDTETGWSSSPPTRNDQTQPRTGAHGGWPPQVYRDPRVIRLDGWVYAPTWEARRDAEHHLAALCAQSGREYPLSCTEELGELVASVTQDDTTLVSVQPGGLWLDFSLQLVAADPRKYSAAEQTVETGLPGDSITGLDFGPLDVDGLDFAAMNSGTGLDFGLQFVTGRATATNAGTADTTPTLTLTGPLIPPVTITRPDTSARIIYHDPLDADDRLVIDITRRTVQLGTTSRRHRATITDWDGFIVPPASTVDYVLHHGGAPNAEALLTVRWQSAFW